MYCLLENKRKRGHFKKCRLRGVCFLLILAEVKARSVNVKVAFSPSSSTYKSEKNSIHFFLSKNPRICIWLKFRFSERMKGIIKRRRRRPRLNDIRNSRAEPLLDIFRRLVSRKNYQDLLSECATQIPRSPFNNLVFHRASRALLWVRFPTGTRYSFDK